MYITKSDYVSFITCPKSLWLKKYKKELAEISESTKKRMTSGVNVGKLARDLFGNYVDVTTKTESGALNLIEMANKTEKYLKEHSFNIICEAAFLKDNLYCAVDILKVIDNEIEIYEVKSSTAVAEYHIFDASFQYFVLTSLGYKVKNVFIVTINSDYIRQNELEIDKLFKINCINEQVLEHQPLIHNNIENINNLYNNNEPSSVLDKHCKKPHECEFKKYCYKDIPSPSVFDLAGSRKIYSYYKEGIITYNDLYNSKHFQKLSDINKKQVTFELENKPIYVNKEKVKNFLNTIKYPLYLLDFETFQPIVPLFPNTSPYQQITFQYSLHILYEDGKLEHKEFLATERLNPTYNLAISLLNDIPSNSMIMAYNMSFEKTRIKELANMYPELKYRLLNRLNNFIDLMEPFKNQDIYKKEFQGSYSIKYILPGLFPNDPDLDYHNLDIIHNGGEAMTMYELLPNYTKEERLKIRSALLKYCELDTYAMYKILMKLYELAD